MLKKTARMCTMFLAYLLAFGRLKIGLPMFGDSDVQARTGSSYYYTRWPFFTRERDSPQRTMYVKTLCFPLNAFHQPKQGQTTGGA